MKLCYFFQAARFMKPYNESSLSRIYNIVDDVDPVDTKNIICI